MRSLEEMHKRQDELDEAMRKRHAELEAKLPWLAAKYALFVLAASIAAVLVRVVIVGH